MISDAYRVYLRTERKRGRHALTNRQWERRKLDRAARRNPDPTYADFLAPWRAR